MDLKRQFFRYTALNMLAAISMSAYFLADTYFVARSMGEMGLSAVNLTFPAYSLIFAVGILLSVGSATRYALEKASGNREAATIFPKAVTWGILAGAILALSGYALSGRILYWMSHDQVLAQYTRTYLVLLMAFAPAFILNYIASAFTRNTGRPRLAMTAALIGNLFNIFADYYFMIRLSWGLAGAALATGLSPLLSLLIQLPFLLSGESGLDRGLRLSGLRTLFSLSRLGLYGCFSELAAVVSSIIYNALFLKYSGISGLAAYGIIANVSFVVLALFTGLSDGIQPLFSSSFGRGEQREVKQLLGYGFLLSFAVALFLWLFLELKADWIAFLFWKELEGESSLMTATGLHLYFSLLVFSSFNTLLAGYFSSTDRALSSALISLLRGLIFLVPMLFLLSAFLGYRGLYLAFPCSEVIAFVCALILKRLSDR